MDKRLQVFVSSTYEDLRLERQAAVEEILRAGHIPAGMELFAAGDESQMTVIRRWIDQSDVFMLILGGRYGSVEPKSGKSYVHLEHEYAAEKGKPRFRVVLRDTALERLRTAEPGRVESARVGEYAAFRKEIVDSKVCAFFEDAKDVRLAVHQSLNELIRQGPISGGWVSVRDVTDPRALADEIARLGSENRELRARLASAEEAVASRAKDGGALDLSTIRRTLESMEITVPAKLTGTGKEWKTNLATLFLNNADVFSGGQVSNAANASELDAFWFFTVAPKLAVFDLVKRHRPARVRYDIYQTTPLGNRIVAEHRIAVAKAKSANMGRVGMPPSSGGARGPGRPKGPAVKSKKDER